VFCETPFLESSSDEPVTEEIALPGSEPPETNDNVGRSPSANELAAAIQADFRLLIATIARQIELQENPDSDVLGALWNVKAAAERGLRLSERLGDAVKDDNAGR
jgi:hypothetical protein